MWVKPVQLWVPDTAKTDVRSRLPDLSHQVENYPGADDERAFLYAHSPPRRPSWNPCGSESTPLMPQDLTCSPVVEETTALVAGVTHLDDHFLMLDTPAVLDRISVKTMPPHTRGTAVQLWTHRHGTDAMFPQLIKRMR